MDAEAFRASYFIRWEEKLLERWPDFLKYGEKFIYNPADIINKVELRETTLVTCVDIVRVLSIQEPRCSTAIRYTFKMVLFLCFFKYSYTTNILLNESLPIFEQVEN